MTNPHQKLTPWTLEEHQTFVSRMYNQAALRQIHGRKYRQSIVWCSICGVATQNPAGPERCQSCEERLYGEARVA